MKSAIPREWALDRECNAPPAPQPPLNPMLICSEPTFDGLERLFSTEQPSMGVFSARGRQYIGGHGMREETKLRRAAALSSMWDGQPIRRARPQDSTLGGAAGAVNIAITEVATAQQLGDVLQVRTA